MPVVAVATATAVAVSGLPATVRDNQEVDLADPVQVFGLGATPVFAPVAPSPNPDAVRARVLDDAGAFICHLPRADGLRWLDEFNSPGAGSIDTRRYDDVETDHPGLWAPGNQIIVAVGSTDVFRIILDNEPGYRIDTDTGARIDSWAGVGALGVLNSGMVEPEYGWRPEATSERSFDYGSNPSLGGWIVPAEWHTPVGIAVRKSWRWTHKKRHRPKGWPEKQAQWLWWRSPDSPTVPDETCYFRSSFTLSKTRRIKFWVCGDDAMEFQLDSEVRITTGPGDWAKASTFTVTLAAGIHYIAAKVTNTPASDDNANRAGFLLAAGRLNGDGDVVEWVRRTTPSTWLIRRQLSGAPGWYPAQILRRLVDEQIVRGCAGHSGITFGFTTATDSEGSSWTGARNEQSLTVGTLGLEYTQRLVEAGMDVAMTPALRLNAYRSRGADRSSYIRLNQDRNVVDEAGSPTAPIRNVMFARARTGWIGGNNAASLAARGRRETMATFGSSRSAAQTAAQINRMLPDLANGIQTLEVHIDNSSGPQPYSDFNVGDWVSYRPSGATGYLRHRVMSITGEVTDTGRPAWTVQIIED